MGGEAKTNMSTAASSYPKLAAHPVGKKIHNIYLDRLRMFTSGGQYEKQNLPSKLYEGRATGDEWVKLEVYSPPDLARPTFKDATSHEFRPTHVGESFGPSWATHWFKIHLTIPDHLRKMDHLEFHWDASNEGMIWTQSGEVVHGLTGGDRTEWILPDSFRDGRTHVFYIEMACNGMFGNAIGDNIQPPPKDRTYQLWKADIVAVNLEARALSTDFWIIGDAAREFPGDSWECHKAFDVCNAIMDKFIEGDGSKEAIVDCRKIARQYLGNNVDSSKVYDNDNEILITGIGQCHIDTCWLWPWAETKRKVARSWSNQCDLMDRYPEYKFCCSQAQQYKWLEEYYPSLFDRVKDKVKKGTFQPIGGSWVEHDTNMPSGESLVRQFLYGQRFFESHFGQRCQTFWLPDTFGYSSQLPQLCRLAGMSRFFTQKLSWNNINNFPHTTFNWVALDGTQVLCHMTPAETYTAEANFGDIKRSITQHKSMDQDPTSLLVFGKGDGGGGPTWEHLEKLRRERAISDTIGLLPRVKLGDNVDDFFARLEKKAQKGTEFVTWYGELYFELHRGTYTTQANNKRNNRKTEFLLRDVEYLCTMATIKDLMDSKVHQSRKYRYPKKDIDFMWEAVLLCQFHDCLPGSSIEMCYDDSDKLYEQVFKTGEKCLEDALQALGFEDYNSSSGEPFAINTLPWDRQEMVRLPGNGTEPVYAIACPGTPVDAIKSSGHKTGKATISEIRDDVFQLSNTRFDVKVADGVITSIYDKKAKREVVAKGGKANQLVIFDDKPLYWQAWDVEVYHIESRKELHPSKTYIAESGPHRVSVVVETQISKESWAKSTISLEADVGDAEKIEIQCEVEWRETMKFLKVEFPVDIVNTEASYETQFGINRRPTHYNTSWDMAKFEVCCHKWADLSEAGYGVSILNDSKYGFATCGNLMRLSLLRAPKAPDGHADMGRHNIRYAILPHEGPLNEHTIRAGYAFNNPLRLYRHPKAKNNNILHSLLRAFSIRNAPGLIIDTVKRAEDDEDVSVGAFPSRKGKSIIVRVFDSLGGKSTGDLHWGIIPVKKVFVTNLLEDDGEELEVQSFDAMSDGVEITVRAFEVLTLRLQLYE